MTTQYEPQYGEEDDPTDGEAQDTKYLISLEGDDE